jgi:hypothetical protein
MPVNDGCVSESGQRFVFADAEAFTSETAAEIARAIMMTGPRSQCMVASSKWNPAIRKPRRKNRAMVPTNTPPYAESRKVTSRDLRVMSLATVTF